MRFALSKPRAFLLGIALIVLTNGIMLAGVAYNRSGEPEAVLELSGRELQINRWRWPANENSSIDVHLTWHVARTTESNDCYPGLWSRELDWLGPAELRELGFDVDGDIASAQVAERIRRQPSRRARFVLEFDGPAYQAAVERARQELERAKARVDVDASDRKFQEELNAARAQVENLEKSESRLFVMDAGTDERTLRARYPDRRRYLILPGRIDVTVVGDRGRRRLMARLVDMDARTIRVPHPYRALLEPFVASRAPADLLNHTREEPRFSATVHFGRRFEPWIVDLALLK